MIGCGISISGSEAIFVWVDLATRLVLQEAKARVKLNDPYSQGDVVQTSDLIRQLIAERSTDVIVVRKSSTSGKFSASHAAFRLEALIMMASPVDVRFISPQACSAFLKRSGFAVPASVLKYQSDAFLALVAAMEG